MENELEQFTYREILSQSQSWEASLTTLPVLPPAVLQRMKRLNVERD